MYETFQELLNKRGLKPFDVSKATGISSSTLTDWKKGRSVPKQDKMQKIADFFGVSVDYLMTGEESNGYYLNDDAKDMAQFLFDNPEYKVLFDASRKVKPEDIQFVKEMMDRMSNRD